MTETKVREIAVAFLKAIQTSDLSASAIGEEAYLRMKDFPRGACSEMTEMMGIFLRERYNLDPIVLVSAQIEEGERWSGTHRWLEYDGLIIDITADQFFDHNEPVIVARESTFHSRYANKVHRHRFTMSRFDLLSWMHRLYQLVTSRVTKVVG
jgi:hypothetical protein